MTNDWQHSSNTPKLGECHQERTVQKGTLTGSYLVGYVWRHSEMSGRRYTLRTAQVPPSGTTERGAHICLMRATGLSRRVTLEIVLSGTATWYCARHGAFL